MTHNDGTGLAEKSHSTESSLGVSTSQSLDSTFVSHGELDTPWPVFDYNSLDLIADPKPSSAGQVATSSSLDSEATYLPLVEAPGLPTMEIGVGSDSDQQAVAVLDLTPLRDRWLINVFFLSGNTCHPDNASVQLYGQIIRTYPRMWLQKDQLPPVIQPWQLSVQSTPVPLANCITLVRMWENRVEGAEQLVIDSVRRETERLFDQVHPAISILGSER